MQKLHYSLAYEKKVIPITPTLPAMTNAPCLTLKVPVTQLMHCDTLKQDNDSTVRGDGGSRVGEVRAGTTSPMPEHKGFKLQ